VQLRTERIISPFGDVNPVQAPEADLLQASCVENTSIFVSSNHLLSKFVQLVHAEKVDSKIKQTKIAFFGQFIEEI
jgi:hypothetical protein